MKLRITKSKIDNSDNLLPLVNIIFLLLIFFMMAGIIGKTKELNDISLATVTIEEYQENDQPVLFINKNGQLILNDTPVTLENLKNNKDGELVVSGSQVTKGYLNDNEKTNQSFVRFDWDQDNDLWYRTGDLVFMNDDNNIEFIGRKDKQIKLAGRRIELGEIEYIIKKYGGLDEIVIVAKKDTNGVVEHLVAFTTKKLFEDEINIIRKECEKHLERIFFPQEFRYIEEIPITISGKIDKTTLERIAP